MPFSRPRATVVSLLIAALFATASHAQQVADPGFKSVGRGAPLAAVLRAPALPAGPSSPEPIDFEQFSAEMRRYPFVGEFHESTAKGVVIAE